MAFLGFFPQFRAMILASLPNLVQSILAGVGDYYTWQLAQKLYGVGSTTAWTTVCRVSMLNPYANSILPASLGAVQSLGMVLFNEDVLKFSGDYYDHNCTVLLAMADNTRLHAVGQGCLEKDGGSVQDPRAGDDVCTPYASPLVQTDSLQPLRLPSPRRCRVYPPAHQRPDMVYYPHANANPNPRAID